MNKIPKLRFPEFSGEWEEKELGEICEISKAKYNPEKELESYKCLEMEHFSQGTGRILGFCDSSEQKSIKNKFKTGEILFGKLRPYLRKYWKADFDGVCSSEVWVMRGKKVSSNFLYRIVQSNKFNLISNISAGSKMPRADWDYMSEFPFFYPSLPEQEEIASFLSSVDSKIEKLERKKELWEQYKKGMMQKIFSQELRFRDENGEDYPEWEEKQLKEILIEHKIKNSFNEYSEVFSVAKEKGVINQIEHLGRSFASSDISNYKVVFPNDVVYTKSPTSGFPFGIIKQNMLERIGVVSTLYAVYKPINKHVGFLLDSYFKSDKNTYNYLNPLVQKGAKNTMNINNSTFLEGAQIKLPVDELEQTQIADLLSSIDSKIEIVEKELAGMKEFKKGLLQKMFV